MMSSSSTYRYLLSKEEPFLLSKTFCKVFWRIAGSFIKPSGYYMHAQGTSLHPARIRRDDPFLLQTYDHMLEKDKQSMPFLHIVEFDTLPTCVFVQPLEGGESIYVSVEEALHNGENPFRSVIRLSDTTDIFYALHVFKITEHNDDIRRLREFADSGRKMLDLIVAKAALHNIVDHKMKHEAKTDEQKRILVTNSARLKAYYEQTLDTVLRRIADLTEEEAV